MSQHAGRFLKRQDAVRDARGARELVAGNVRAARARLKLRQQDLADDMGWPRLTVTSIELGRKRVTLADAVALCGALRIDLRQLLAGAEPDVLQKLGIDRRAEPTP